MPYYAATHAYVDTDLGGGTDMALATGSKSACGDAFRVAALSAAGLSLSQCLPATASSSVFNQGSMPTPDEALRMLVEGNLRWVAGTAAHPDQSVDRRAQLTSGQQPF